MSYEATCSCGQLKLTYNGDITRTAVCHCLDCQKRTGSAFADPTLPSPTFMVYGNRKHHWVTMPETAIEYFG